MPRILMEETVNDLLMRGFYSTAFHALVDTSSLEPLGYEALLRGPKGSVFNEPDRLFNGRDCLPVDMLYKLDMACLGSAVRNGRLLSGRGLLFVNIISMTLIKLADNAGDFVSLLRELGIDPARVVFEISETTARSETREISKCLDVYRNSGIRVALDDIGVRSPYLDHILWFEPDFVKLDRTFISGLHTNQRKQELVSCIKYMCERMGACLVAEGVETDEELAALKSIKVSVAQGFLFGRPMSAESIMRGTENPQAVLSDRQAQGAS